MGAHSLAAEDSTAHPAWDMENPHRLLHIFDKRIYPSCLVRTYDNLQLLYKPLGQIIRELNSSLGIPHSDYATMVRSSLLCDGCKSQFSIDGYNQHITDGRCTNHPDLEPGMLLANLCLFNVNQCSVEACEASDPSFRFRSFRDGRRPAKIGETLDSPVGAALLEWNSRIGIPTDVWMLVSTAVVLCHDCDLVRSFPAHLLHLEAGSCTDPGQSLTLDDVDDADD